MFQLISYHFLEHKFWNPMYMVMIYDKRKWYGTKHKYAKKKKIIIVINTLSSFVIKMRIDRCRIKITDLLTRFQRRFLIHKSYVSKNRYYTQK